MACNLNINTGDFLSFADYFFLSLIHIYDTATYLTLKMDIVLLLKG